MGLGRCGLRVSLGARAKARSGIASLGVQLELLLHARGSRAMLFL
jgi:hypothetical protein